MRYLSFLLIVPAASAADYTRDVKPLLAERCYACHGALKQQGKLRLDSGLHMRQAGAVVPGKSADSPLVQRISDPDEHSRMPPEGVPLTAEQIAKVKAWIDAGAVVPADDAPERDPRDHWAFRPPVRPPVPAGDWGTTAVDRFLAADWKKHGLSPAAPADKRLFLRRLSIDLVGLPPTAAESDAFVHDSSTDAVAKVVDRLLASPQHGERWGRHLMDIHRYSDWWGLGAEVRNSHKHLWHWRDWLVESLNADKGYDAMIREMLAADELHPTDPDKLRATGYLARSYFLFNRTTWLDETIEHAAKGFLGLTFNCAKCHDHKYDPVSHSDYYRLRAFFEPYQLRTDMVAGQFDMELGGLPRAFDANLDAPTFRHERGEEAKAIKSAKIEPGLPAVFAASLSIKPVVLPTEAHSPQLRSLVEENHRRQAEANVAAAMRGVADAERTLESLYRTNPNQWPPKDGSFQRGLMRSRAALAVAEAERSMGQARFAAERDPSKAALAARAERLHALRVAEHQLAVAEHDRSMGVVDAPKRVDAGRIAVAQATKALEKPGESFSRARGALKTKESNVEDDASRFKPFPTTSTGRRTALANWIASDKNPLAARVIVNHVWARHFGRPLVPTVFDFGRKGAPPSHPELLDWLAVEFLESGWSLKHLHRILVTSDAYRLGPAIDGRDPENRHFARRTATRMESQVVRDSLLHLGGRLDPARGGPSIPVGAPTNRRSLYFVHSANDRQAFLKQFDDAAVMECYRRTESIVPQQALTLANSAFALESAVHIAATIPGGTDDEFIVRAFELLLGTTPTPDERRECRSAMEEWRSQSKDAHRPRTLLVGALLNHNDFVTVR